MKKLITLVLLACQLSLLSQTPELVMDFNPGSADAVPDWGTSVLSFPDIFYFTLATKPNQTDLFYIYGDQLEFISTICTDCEPPGTPLLAFEYHVLFTVKDNGSIYLWATDGLNGALQLGELDGPVSYMVVGNNKKAYIATGSSLYVIDGTELNLKKLNTSFLDFASHDDNKDDKIFVPYKNGIAFLTNKFGNAALNYAEDAITPLGTFDAGSSFTDLYGLCEVAGGLVFGVENEGMYHYHESTGIKKTQLPEPLRLLEFNGSAVHYHYGNGLTLLHDFPLKSTSLIENYGFVVQSEELNRSVIGDNMILHIDDYNSSKDLIINIDKKTKTAKIIGNIAAYPSNFISYYENILFFDGTSNGFNPTLYHIKNNFNNLGNNKYTFNFSSIDGPSAIPVGLSGNELYFFSNMNPSKGRELYKINVALCTKTEDVIKNNEFDFTVVNNNITVTGHEKQSLFEVIILDTAGKVLNNKWVNAGETTPLSQYHQTVIIMVVENESKKTLAKKIFMN
ncbi:MAG TPA: hypothetical protein PKA12_06575 [Saprospiraceae bacterium]|mgnify:CR=1 FL=1|nr:hypothetical protein [Saprospiraceae bacterium]